MTISLYCQRCKDQFIKIWHWVCAGITVALMVGMIIGFALFSEAEQSHYHMADCNVSNCVIADVNTCSRYFVPYACYDGSFHYSVIVDNIVYDNTCSFSHYDDDNYNNYLICISNGTTWCAYDDRDVKGTLTRDYNPEWRNLTIVCFAAGAIIIVAIVFAVYCQFEKSRWCRNCNYIPPELRAQRTPQVIPPEQQVQRLS